ncbi:MAG TPA: ABC transporter ATP-binding protein [Gaiellaceae bacterium]|nr:ABC transporter ATP-binding protein [Gaiellaceae bacterium]
MLEVEEVTVRFGETLALDRISLEVADGEVVTVLGPSGSGKTTLLRVIAGLQRPDAGRVLLDGRDLAGVPPHRRGIGLVFQDHALFQHRDVWGNVAFGLRMRGEPRAAIDRRVGELLELVGLAGYERRSVATLSGGEAQRVALARALAPEPRVLLLDEPLGSLDRRLRDRLLDDLGRLFAELRVTALYVTHDQAEAFALGDRVAVMRAGRVVQTGTPDELWARPADADVARFLGLRNVWDGRIVRPEAVSVQRVEGGAGGGDGVVEAAVRQGPTVRLVVRLDDGSALEAAVASLDHPLPGDRVRVDVDRAGVVELVEPVSDTAT